MPRTTRWLGENFITLPVVDSTNNYLKENAAVLPHGAAQAAKLDPAFAAAMEELTAALGKEE